MNSILEDISKRSCDKGINENELASLQSILVKLLSHYEGLEDVLALVSFFSAYFLVSFLFTLALFFFSFIQSIPYNLNGSIVLFVFGCYSLSRLLYHILATYGNFFTKMYFVESFSWDPRCNVRGLTKSCHYAYP